jgi:segregation and condensation protein B
MADSSRSNADERVLSDNGSSDLAKPDDQGLSLDELSESFARLLKHGELPYDAAEQQEDESQAPDPDLESDSEPSSLSAILGDPTWTESGEDDEDECPVTPRTIFEAMLFVGNPDNEPLTSEEVADLMRGVRPEEIDKLVAELNEDYDAQGAPYRVESVGKGYCLSLRPEFEDVRQRFYGRVKEARLSQAAIDVLALVAYNQPMASNRVDQLRGKPSGNILAQLVRRKLLSVEYDSEVPRKKVYRTTRRFTKLFCLSSLDDLPKDQEAD